MIADGSHVRLVGNLPEAVTDALIAPHLRTAKKRLINWVGSSNYESAETEVNNARANLGQGEELDIDSLSDLAQALIDAEAYLTLAVGLPSFNMVMNDSSGVSAEGTQGESNYRYLTPKEVKDAQTNFLRNAEIAAKEYMTTASLGPDISYAYDSDGEPIDDDYPE